MNLQSDDGTIHSMSYLGSQDCACAVRPVTYSLYDYFIFLMTEPVQTLFTDHTEEYGNVLLSGLEVLLSLFYCKQRKKCRNSVQSKSEEMCNTIQRNFYALI